MLRVYLNIWSLTVGFELSVILTETFASQKGKEQTQLGLVHFGRGAFYAEI